MATIAADKLLAEHEPALRNFLGARCRDDDLTAEMLQEVAARLVTATPRLLLNATRAAPVPHRGQCLARPLAA